MFIQSTLKGIANVSKSSAEIAKNNPFSVATIGAIAAAAVSMFTLDDRYAKAADVQEQGKQIEQVADLLKANMRIELTLLKMKIASGKATPEDKVKAEELEKALNN